MCGQPLKHRARKLDGETSGRLCAPRARALHVVCARKPMHDGGSKSASRGRVVGAS